MPGIAGEGGGQLGVGMEGAFELQRINICEEQPYFLLVLLESDCRADLRKPAIKLHPAKEVYPSPRPNTRVKVKSRTIELEFIVVPFEKYLLKVDPFILYSPSLNIVFEPLFYRIEAFL